MLVTIVLVLGPLGYLIYGYTPEFFHGMFDKSSSYGMRMLGIYSVVSSALEYPFGIPYELVTEEGIGRIEGSTVTAGVLHWMQFGGIQSVFLLVMLLFIWFRDIIFLIKNGSGFYVAIGYGALAYFLEESFYGDYFEFLFVALMAIVSASSMSVKRQRKTMMSA